jgi:hypothetical protein
MPEHTRDLTINISDEGGDVLLEKTITVTFEGEGEDDPPQTGYGYGGWGRGNYGDPTPVVTDGGYGIEVYGHSRYGSVERD